MFSIDYEVMKSYLDSKMSPSRHSRRTLPHLPYRGTTVVYVHTLYPEAVGSSIAGSPASPAVREAQVKSFAQSMKLFGRFAVQVEEVIK